MPRLFNSTYRIIYLIFLIAQYKRIGAREALAEDLQKRILFAGIANLILLPVIFCWTLVFTFFNYVAVIKREPGNFKHFISVIHDVFRSA